MEKSTKQITAYIVSDDVVPSASVTVGFEYVCNWFVLQKLLRGEPCSCLELAFASENTCMAYSIYEAISEKLIGSPLEQSKSRISTIKCNYQNNEFIMTFNCPNDLPTIKKILHIVASKITPHKYYTKYSHNIKLINGKPFKNEFLYCANLLSGVHLKVFIIGKFNQTQEKFNAVITTTEKKYTSSRKAPGGLRPRSLDKKQGETNYPVSVASGYKTIFIKDFIKSETGYPVVPNSGQVIVYNKKWSIDSKKIKASSVRKYVGLKYTKLKTKFVIFVLYSVASECVLDVTNMIKLHKENPPPSAVVKWITDSL